jgi:hypothetical protein
LGSLAGLGGNRGVSIPLFRSRGWIPRWRRYNSLRSNYLKSDAAFAIFLLTGQVNRRYSPSCQVNSVNLSIQFGRPGSSRWVEWSACVVWPLRRGMRPGSSDGSISGMKSATKDRRVPWFRTVRESARRDMAQFGIPPGGQNASVPRSHSVAETTR